MILGKVIGNDRQYRIDDIIAKGAFSTVYRCENLLTGCKYAIKVINKEVVQRYTMKQALIREVNAMEASGCSPYTAKLVDKLVSQNNYYIVMDLAEGGTLLDLIRRRCKNGPHEWGKSLCKQLLMGVANLHECNIVHRDIKPENILLNKDKTKIMISDFGFSCYAPVGSMLHRECGTLKYCAPELLRENPSYDGRKVDVWATGITIYLVIFGVHPFSCKKRDPDVLLELISRKPLTFPSQASPELEDMLRKMLEKDPNKRWNAADLLHHPWIEATSVPSPCESEEKLHSNDFMSHGRSGGSVARSPLVKMSTDDLEVLNSFSSSDNIDDGFYFLSQSGELKETFFMEDTIDVGLDSPTAPIVSRDSESLSTLGSASFQSSNVLKGTLRPSCFVVQQPKRQNLSVSNFKMHRQRLVLEMWEILCLFIFCAVCLLVIFVHFSFEYFIQNFSYAGKLCSLLESLLTLMYEIVAPCRNKRSRNDLSGGLSSSKDIRIPKGNSCPQALESRVSYYIEGAAIFFTNMLQNFLPMHKDIISRNLKLHARQDTRSANACARSIPRKTSETEVTNSVAAWEGMRVISPLVPPSDENEKKFLGPSHQPFH